MRFIAFILAAALCLAPVSAVDVYDLRSDAQFMSLNSGLATAAADDSWYDSMLQDVEWIMFDVADIASDVDTIRTLLGFPVHVTLYDCLADLVTSSSDSLAYVGDIASWLGADSWDSNLFTLGEWLGLDGASSSSASIYDLLYSQASLTSSMLDSLGLFYASFDDWVSQLFVPAGSNYFHWNGSLNPAPDGGLSFTNLVRYGFMGLRSLSVVAKGNSMLSTSGDVVSTTSEYTLTHLIRSGFVGLSRNINSISSGSYLVDLFDSDSGVSGSVSTAASMGAMIDKYLDAMQDDLGALTFIHADSDAVQAKKDALDNEVAVTDSFLSPGSAGSLSVSDIGDAANAVGGTKDLFDTGVSVGQAFEQLQGSGPLEFFTSMTASNLNTVPATASDLEDDDFVHFYDPSNSEFFELIGKGNG